MVAPLSPGTRVVERFEIGEVVGRGGFSIVYDVLDLRRGDRAILKEFTPPSARRDASGLVDLGPNAATLRQAFLAEAQTLGRLALPGVLPVRLAFVANGTACVVTDRVPGAKTLDKLIREGPPLDATGVLDIAYPLMETLEAVHDKGLLHRDVKPSNVLVAPAGKVFLLDFGAARSWTADATEAHTVLFTPGYAPLEQHTSSARRGPATDVYGLCATLYAALAGRAPTDAVARAGGEALPSLAQLRPELDPGLVQTVEAGLALRAAERPATIGSLRKLLDEGPGSGVLDTLESLDDLLVRAQRFSFNPRACPACQGVLERPKPLGRNVCPVCRTGRIRQRKLSLRACPHCRSGILRQEGKARAKVCDTCAWRYEPMADGRWREVDTGRMLYPEEWARIAAGLDPHAGDAFCDACDAEFGRADDRFTLLSAMEDPHGFAAAYRGRPFATERLRWLAVGKQSPHPGLVCERCETEFDHTGRLFTLVGSPNRRLDRLAGDTRSLESWHRIAEGLPDAGREAQLEDRIAQSLGAAYRRGEVGFGESLWRGPAEFEGRATVLKVTDDGFRIGRALRSRYFATGDLEGLRAEGDWILAEGPHGSFEVRIEPVELVAHLRSGDRAVLLTATDLAARLAWAGHLRERFRMP